MDEINDIEELAGHKQTAKTRRKIAKNMTGTKNPAWKDGRHQDTYRRIAGAKKGDLVHHKDKNRHHNKPSNLKVIPKKQRGKHDSTHHREKNFRK